MVGKTALITIDVETDLGGRASVQDENVGLEKELSWLLDELKQQGIAATFFVSANLFPKYSALLRRITKEGHEIACHGMNHEDYSKYTKDELVKNLKKCKEVFKKEGFTVEGFRAPQFKHNDFLEQALIDANYSYDSSQLVGFLPNRHKMKKKQWTKLSQVVVSTLFLRIPLGLMWINAMGLSIARIFLRSSPLVVYLHPYDLVYPKKLKNLGVAKSLFYWYRQKTVKSTFTKLLDVLKKKKYHFKTVQGYVSNEAKNKRK